MIHLVSKIHRIILKTHKEWCRGLCTLGVCLNCDVYRYAPEWGGRKAQEHKGSNREREKGGGGGVEAETVRMRGKCGEAETETERDRDRERR